MRIARPLAIAQFLILFVALDVLCTAPAQAMQYLVSFESFACNTVISPTYDGNTIEGVAWDLYVYDVDPVVRCPATIPMGARLFEWVVPTNMHGGLIQWYTPSFAASTPLVNEGIYYLGGFYKFVKTGDDIWADTGQADSWDKLIDVSAPGIRWGVGVGWPASVYDAVNGKFTFDLWCAQSAFTACTSADHKAQNQNGYSKSNPYQADYGKWMEY